MGEAARMVIPIDVLTFDAVRDDNPGNPRKVDVRFITSLEGARFLLEHWMRTPTRFAEITLVEPVPSLFRSRCIGCGHYDNEIASVAKCPVYATGGHHMVLVDNGGTPKIPLTHVPTVAAASVGASR